VNPRIAVLVIAAGPTPEIYKQIFLSFKVPSSAQERLCRRPVGQHTIRLEKT